MMIRTKKRKGMDNFQLQELRYVVKKGGKEVLDSFRENTET